MSAISLWCWANVGSTSFTIWEANFIQITSHSEDTGGCLQLPRNGLGRGMCKNEYDYEWSKVLFVSILSFLCTFRSSSGVCETWNESNSPPLTIPVLTSNVPDKYCPPRSYKMPRKIRTLQSRSSSLMWWVAIYYTVEILSFSSEMLKKKKTTPHLTYDGKVWVMANCLKYFWEKETTKNNWPILASIYHVPSNF